jgi:hypothetical protein
MIYPVTAICAWLLSITLVLAGGFTHRSVPLCPAKSTLLWIEILLVSTFVIRILSIDHIPIILTGDEGSVGIEAIHFVNGERNNIFVVGWFSFPTLFFFIQSLSTRVFGQTAEALRISSALIGALTVPTLYLVGKKMFNSRAGLLAALSLATLHLHMHFSRIGLNNIWDGLWYVIVIGALWIGWKHEDRRAFMLAGLGLGLSQYFYPTSRALFIILLISIAIAFIFNRQKLHRALPHILVMLLIALVVFLPLGLYYAKFPREYLAPLARVSLFGDALNNQIKGTGLPAWRILVTQISTALQAYTFTPIRSYYKPEIPILQPLAASFFYIGLILLVFRYRDERLALLVLWLSIIGLISGLSDTPPAAQRYVAATPACSLLVGIGVDGSAKFLSTRMPKVTKFINVLVFVTIVSIMINDLQFYFVKYTQISYMQNTHSNGMIAQHLADELKDKPKGTQVFFFGTPDLGYYSIPSIAYLAPQVTGIDIKETWSSLSEKPNILSDQAFFVFLSEREGEIQTVQNDHPGGMLTSERAWNNDVLFWLYEVHKSP